MPIGTGYDDFDTIDVAKKYGPKPFKAARGLDFDASGVDPEKVHNVGDLGETPASVHSAGPTQPDKVTDSTHQSLKG